MPEMENRADSEPDPRTVRRDHLVERALNVLEQLIRSSRRYSVRDLRGSLGNCAWAVRMLVDHIITGLPQYPKPGEMSDSADSADAEDCHG